MANQNGWIIGPGPSDSQTPDKTETQAPDAHKLCPPRESMAHPKAGQQQCPGKIVSSTSLLFLLLLVVGVPVCQPFGGFSSNSLNLRLRSCRISSNSSRTAVVAAAVGPRRRRRHRSSSRITPPLSAAVAAATATPGGGDEENIGHSIVGDVITGSNQLESWKTNTASSTPAEEAPKRSNVMGRAAATAAEATTTTRSVGSIGDSDTRKASLPPSPPPPLPRLERDGGGVVRGEASPAWRVEAATTTEELLSCFKVRGYCSAESKLSSCM